MVNKLYLQIILLLSLSTVGFSQEKINFSKKGYSQQSFIENYAHKLKKKTKKDVLVFHDNICLNNDCPKAYFAYTDKKDIKHIRVLALFDGFATVVSDSILDYDTLLCFIKKNRLDTITSKLKYVRSQSSHPGTFSYNLLLGTEHVYFFAYENQFNIVDKRIEFIHLAISLLKDAGILQTSVVPSKE